MLEPSDVRRYGRELRAMVRAGTHDPEAFAVVAELLTTATAALSEAAGQLIADGYSWAEIGRALGVTRQAAHARYTRRGNGR